MPGLSIYVNDEIYAHLRTRGKPSAVGKRWIEDRYNEEIANQDVVE